MRDQNWIRDWDDLLESYLSLLGEYELREIVAEAGQVVGLKIMELVGSTYPPEPPERGGDRSPLQTPKQIRWWWAMMHAIANGQPVPDSLRGWKAAYKTVNGVKTLVIDSSSGYKRTGSLVRSIGYEVREYSRGIDLLVGPSLGRDAGSGKNVEDYAKFVIDLPPPEGEQARIHQDRWVPLARLIEEHIDELYALWWDEIKKRLQQRLGRGS